MRKIMQNIETNDQKRENPWRKDYSQHKIIDIPKKEIRTYWTDIVLGTQKT